MSRKRARQTERSGEEERYVQCVRGRPYYVDPPAHSPIWIISLALITYFVTDNLVHLGGIVMVIIAFNGANARFSFVPLLTSWLPIIAMAIYSRTNPDIGIPLTFWGAVAWFVFSMEIRLTMKPCPNPENSVSTNTSDHDVDIPMGD